MSNIIKRTLWGVFLFVGGYLFAFAIMSLTKYDHVLKRVDYLTAQHCDADEFFIEKGVLRVKYLCNAEDASHDDV